MTHLNETPLSPPDLCFLGENAATVQFVFEWPGHLDAQKLQSSLDETLAFFWPMSSEIDLSSSHPRFIQKRGSRIEIQRDTSDTILDLKDPKVSAQLVDEIHSLPNHPLARIRLTTTPSQSLLAVSISHTLVDGYSYFMFMNYWAMIAKGQKADWEPNHDRQKLLEIGFTTLRKAPLSRVTKEVFESRTGLSFGDQRQVVSAKETRWIPKLFSKNELQALQDSGNEGLSLNDLLTASLWKQVAMAWNKPGDTVELSFPMDCRRFKRGFGTTYFGNFIRAGQVKLAFDVLKDLSVVEVAHQIRSTVTSVDENGFDLVMATMLALWNDQGLPGTQRVQVANPQFGFLVTNMSRLDVRGVDFGLGAPTFVATPAPAKRIATVLAHPSGLMVQISQP